MTFTLDGDIDLGTTTTAAVKVATLLGTHYLEVHPRGTGSLPDDQIPLAQTSVPYNLQDVLDQGTQTLEQLDPVKLADALTAVSDTLQTSGDDVGPALEGIGRLSQVVASIASYTKSCACSSTPRFCRPSPPKVRSIMARSAAGFKGGSEPEFLRDVGMV